MSETKFTKGPWIAKKVSGWGDSLSIVPENAIRPIFNSVKPKEYYTDFPTRTDENGDKWTVCSSKAAMKAGNYVSTEEIRAELDKTEKANARLIAASPLLFAAVEEAINLCDESNTTPPQSWVDAINAAKGNL